MKCNYVKKLFNRYLDGTVSEQEKEKNEEHLKRCSNCNKLLEEEENKNFIGDGTNDRIKGFKFLKLRFLRNIVATVIATLLIIAFFTLIVCPITLNYFFNKRMDNVSQALADKIQFTIPCARINGIGSNLGLLNLTVNCDYKIDIIGNNSERNSLLIYPNYIGKTSEHTKVIDEIPLLFNNAIQATNISTFESKIDNLNKVKDTTKSQVVIYFKEPILVDELQLISNKLDADIVKSWYVVDTGDTTPKEYYWGFSNTIKMNSTTYNEQTIVTEHSHYVSQSTNDFKTEMKNFDNISNLLNDGNIENEVHRVNEYISKNGVRFKGAIVTAKTYKIVELVKESNIKDIDTIKIDFDY